MKKVLVITAGSLPMPALKGGAVENLLQILLDRNEADHNFDFVVYSIFDKNSRVESCRFKYTKFEFIYHTSFAYKIFKVLRYLINRLGVYYIGNQFIASVVKKIKVSNDFFDAILIENSPQFAVYLKRKFEVPIIQHIHNDYIYEDSLWCKEILRSSDLIFTVSHYIKRRICEVVNFENLGCDVEVLYNGVDINRFGKEISQQKKNDLRNELGVLQDDILIMYAGRIQENKGLKELISAYADTKNLRTTKLMIVGSSFFSDNSKTPYFKKLYSISNTIRDNVVFTGYIDYNRIHEYYQIADFAVIPSLCQEAFGLTCLESLCAGLPVVISNVGGMPEIVDENCAIILETDFNFVTNLRNSLDDLTMNHELRFMMSLKAKERSKLFGDTVYYNRIVELLNKYI